MSSSGLVPVPLSKREPKEYWPSKAPLPRLTRPFPPLSVPSQTADPLRVIIVILLLTVFENTGAARFSTGLTLKSLSRDFVTLQRADESLFQEETTPLLPFRHLRARRRDRRAPLNLPLAVIWFTVRNLQHHEVRVGASPR